MGQHGTTSCQYRGYEITTQGTTATEAWKINVSKVVDLLAQKLLNDMKLD